MFNKKNDTEVIINNKRYTLSGFESEEYLQKIATFINGKINDLKQQDAYKTMDSEMKAVLLEINLADEYFKLKRQYDESEDDSDSKSNEIYSLKHEIMSLQTKLEKANKEIERLRDQNVDEQKKNVKLETELASERKKGKN
ncbi:MAG: cell division protein ZapA [Lachnospiraceae bacterium]|nr:cell division protein ZapA [Lachnospiraceae bacterium]MBR5731930.1 cell division protein ZapA [Lachnospiraceae bacterium]MBR5967621.1 cell division protein ZapA [Lachnospiraceae bacterium]